LILSGDDRYVNAEIDRKTMCSLLYTSGTMGLSKGVMLSHENIALNVYNMSKHVKIRDDGIGLSVLPMHHTYEFTCHILTGLYQGVGIAICEGLKHIVKNMAEIKATVMLGVPLVFESMHKKIWKQAEATGNAKKMRLAIKLSKMFKLYNHPKIVKNMFKQIHAVTGGHIDIFIVGGAGINHIVIEDLEAMGFPMIQGYGMTESSPIIAVNKECYSKSSSVGLIIPETEAKIIDPDENGTGEIICRGPSIMIGYYDNPEETAKVIKDGWLYTGDYGHFDEDRMLYISGRKKNVIVTKNGKNIFPEEVEFILTQSPYILEALV
jgi:long-chain acyl-CoA synthetase